MKYVDLGRDSVRLLQILGGRVSEICGSWEGGALSGFYSPRREGG